jgi:hypothetical protein
MIVNPKRARLLAGVLVAFLGLAGATAFAIPSMSDCSCCMPGHDAVNCQVCARHLGVAEPPVEAAQPLGCACHWDVSDQPEALLPAVPASAEQVTLPSFDILSSSQPDPLSPQPAFDRTQVIFPTPVLLAKAGTGRRAPPTA